MTDSEKAAFEAGRQAGRGEVELEAGRLLERADVDAYLAAEIEHHFLNFTHALRRGDPGDYHRTRLESTQRLRANMQNLNHVGASRKAVTR
jgi:hypothetical protein